MSKGLSALSSEQLPFSFYTLSTGFSSIESYKALSDLVLKSASEGLSAPGGVNLPAGGNTPYNNSVWNCVVTTGEFGIFQAEIFSEEIPQDLNSTGRTALTTRRDVNINTENSSFPISIRSFKALVNFVESLEDRVSQTGDSAIGDGTYTNVSLRGNTPFQSHEWTVIKLANVYTCTNTVNSN